MYVNNRYLPDYTHSLSLSLIPKSHPVILKVNGDRPEELFLGNRGSLHHSAQSHLIPKTSLNKYLTNVFTPTASLHFHNCLEWRAQQDSFHHFTKKLGSEKGCVVNK